MNTTEEIGKLRTEAERKSGWKSSILNYSG